MAFDFKNNRQQLALHSDIWINELGYYPFPELTIEFKRNPVIVKKDNNLYFKIKTSYILEYIDISLSFDFINEEYCLLKIKEDYIDLSEILFVAEKVSDKIILGYRIIRS